MDVDGGRTDFEFDAFISYSRKDVQFVRKLEAALEGYRPPSGLGPPPRYLRIFRDETDFTGSEYLASLERNLKASAHLLLVCSPSSRQSPYVNGEIELFAKHRGAAHVVTLLLSGIPNNEATPDQEALKAFPDRLLAMLPTPLAADYRSFDLAKDKIARGAFESAWYKVVTDLYQDYGVSRAQIEQREKRRQARRRAWTAGIAGGVMVALAGLAVVAWVQRGEAERQRDEATRQSTVALSRQLTAQADLLMSERSEEPELAALLAAEAVRRSPSLESDRILRAALATLPKSLWVASHGGPVRSVTFTPDGAHLVSGSDDGSVRIFESGGGGEVRRLQFDTAVLAALVSGDGRLLAVGRRDGSVQLWEGLGTRAVWSATCGAPVAGLSFSSDSRRLSAGCRADRTLSVSSPDLVRHVWNVDDGAELSRVTIRGGSGFDADGKYMVTDGDLAEIETQRKIRTLVSPTDHVVRDVAFDGARQRVALGTRRFDPYTPLESGEGRVQVIDIAGARDLWKREYKHGINAIRFGPEDRVVAIGGADGAARILGSPDGREVWRVSHGRAVTAVAVSPRSDAFATGGEDSTVRVFAMRNPLLVASVGDREWRHLSLSGDGRVAAAVGRRGGARIWRVGGETIGSFALDVASLGPPNPVGLSPDGRVFGLGTLEGWIELRQAATGVLVRRVQAKDNWPVGVLAVSREAGHVAMASWHETVRMLEASSGTLVWEVRHRDRVRALAMDAVGRLVASGSDDRTAVVYRFGSGEKVAEVNQSAAVRAVALSGDGRYLATGTEDRKVCIFDAESARPVAVIALQGLPESIAVLREPAAVVVATDRGEVHRYSLNPQDVVTDACSRLGRNLSQSEWASYLGSIPFRKTCPNR